MKVAREESHSFLVVKYKPGHELSLTTRFTPVLIEELLLGWTTILGGEAH